MRSLTLHPASLVAGVVVAALGFISMGQTPPLNARTVNVEYLPNPKDMLTIRGGSPFTVPQGQIFVLTGLGCSTQPNYCGGVIFAVDGVPEVIAPASGPTNVTTTLIPVPAGLTVHGGSVVAVVDNCTMAAQPCLRAVGYLAPQ